MEWLRCIGLSSGGITSLLYCREFSGTYSVVHPVLDCIMYVYQSPVVALELCNIDVVMFPQVFLLTGVCSGVCCCWIGAHQSLYPFITENMCEHRALGTFSLAVCSLFYRNG